MRVARSLETMRTEVLQITKVVFYVRVETIKRRSYRRFSIASRVVAPLSPKKQLGSLENNLGVTNASIEVHCGNTVRGWRVLAAPNRRAAGQAWQRNCSASARSGGGLSVFPGIKYRVVYCVLCVAGERLGHMEFSSTSSGMGAARRQAANIANSNSTKLKAFRHILVTGFSF